MVIVQLTGGLGNQLFQYAMGRALSLRFNSALKVDLSFFENYEWHEYSLSPFCMPIDVATKKESSKLKGTKLNKLLPSFFKQKELLLKEKSILYEESNKYVKPPFYLMGYWQCEEYFIEYKDIIHADFQVKFEPIGKNKAYLAQIRNENSVSIHIRRGNFVNISSVNQVHGTCSLDYYRGAIEFIIRKVEKPVFYVFSDDIEWARVNIIYNGYRFIYVDSNDSKHDYEDLRLMSNCKYNIIANSTFSWWAAWLNTYREKIVIAPKQWFNDEVMNEQASSIVPFGWMRM